MNAFKIALIILLIVVLLLLSVLIYIYSRYPIGYSKIIEEYSSKYDIRKSLIFAIIKCESNFVERAESQKGAMGLMQLMPNTAKFINELDIDSKFNSLQPSFNYHQLAMNQCNYIYDKRRCYDSNGIDVLRDTYVLSQKERVGDNDINLFDPRTNISLGVKYLRYLMNKFDNELMKVIAAYNAGESTVSNWIEIDNDADFDMDDIAYKETKTYVEKVLKFKYCYEKLYKLE